MQPLLPFFPTSTKFINSSVGFREQDGIVYYLHNGHPIYCHGKDDLNGYRFQVANLVVNKLCKICELCTALGEGRKCGLLSYSRHLKHRLQHVCAMDTGEFFSLYETGICSG